MFNSQFLMFNIKPITMDEKNSLSRRQWLGRVTVPALTAAGASMIGVNAIAAPGNDTPDDKLSGTRVYNVQDFGARGDGKTLNTKSIQSAIDAMTKKGGGVVLVPSGLWLTGPITLKSNINLHLANGSTLLFTKDFDQYPLVAGNWVL